MPLFFFAAALALILDQVTKAIVRAQIPVAGRVEAVPGVFHFGHVHNYGAAWGILSGQKVLLIIFTLVVTGLMLFSAREVAARGKIAATGFGLMLGGALGNLIDRVWQGFVTDFIDFDTSVGWIARFPVFNIADSALSVGVVLLLLSLLFGSQSHDASSDDSSPHDTTTNAQTEVGSS